MRHVIALAALLCLSACGGEPEQAPPEAPSPAASRETEALVCSGAWECACAKLKTADKCRTSSARCVWSVDHCLPTYE